MGQTAERSVWPEKEERMLHRFFSAVRGVGTVSGFEHYLMSVQSEGLTGMPTADEARRDYQTLLSSVSKWSTF